MHGSVRFALRSYPGESRYERNECTAPGNGFPDSSCVSWPDHLRKIFDVVDDRAADGSGPAAVHLERYARHELGRERSRRHGHQPSEFDFAIAVALQGTQILVAGGSVLGTQGVIALVRYNADGSLDTSFGSGGIVRTAVPSVDAVGSAIALQGTQILVAGSTFDPSTGMTGIVLARYNPDGSLDTGFAGGPGFVSAPIGLGTDTDTVSLALQGTNIVVAGATRDGNFVLHRYDSSGTLDLSFGTHGTTTTNVGASAMSPGIALQSDGKIVAAGASGSFAGPPINAGLLRSSVDGALDTTFGNAGTGLVLPGFRSSNHSSNAVAVQLGDKIIVAGHAFVDLTANMSDIALLRYNADGTPDMGC